MEQESFVCMDEEGDITDEQSIPEATAPTEADTESAQATQAGADSALDLNKTRPARASFCSATLIL